jgi:chromatin segregation and condensation protein Rec8/ScpA/Scc1 (kleisin family)
MDHSKLERYDSLINGTLKKARRKKRNRNTKPSKKTKKNRNSKPSKRKRKRNNCYIKASAKQRNNYKIKESCETNDLSETESNLDNFLPPVEEELQCSEVYDFFKQQVLLEKYVVFFLKIFR